MLGELDSMIQSYIKSLSNRGGVVNTVIANATAKALMKRYPNVVGEIDVDNSRWAKSLFQRMNFVKRRKTSSKVDIPEGARKEIEYIFLHEIVSLVEEFHIPNSLILNLDQTPLKYVPVGDETMAEKGSNDVTVEGTNDKRCITGTFAISVEGEFLPIHLIYAGKTVQSLPRYKFPKEFCLSVNPKHFSNTEESLKYFEEVILPYVKDQRSKLGLPENQKALIIMDVFTGQTTADVIDCYKKNNMCVVYVPANMTKYYQPLDLTVNGYAKRYFKNKFNEWYSQQVSSQLARGINLENIEVKLKLSLIKPIHAAWVVDFYNHMTTAKGVEIITS